MAGLLAAVIVALAGGAAVSVGYALVARDERRRADERERHATEAAGQLAERGAELRRSLYAAAMAQAGRAYADDNGPLLARLLADATPRSGEDDLRGFEWHALKRLSAVRQIPLPAPPDNPDPDGLPGRFWTEISSDAERVLRRSVKVTPTGFDSRELSANGFQVCDAATGRALSSHPLVEGVKTTHSFSPDGRFLAELATDTKELVVHDPTEARPPARVRLAVADKWLALAGVAADGSAVLIQSRTTAAEMATRVIDVATCRPRCDAVPGGAVDFMDGGQAFVVEGRPLAPTPSGRSQCAAPEIHSAADGRRLGRCELAEGEAATYIAVAGDRFVVVRAVRGDAEPRTVVCDAAGRAVWQLAGAHHVALAADAASWAATVQGRSNGSPTLHQLAPSGDGRLRTVRRVPLASPFGRGFDSMAFAADGRRLRWVAGMISETVSEYDLGWLRDAPAWEADGLTADVRFVRPDLLVGRDEAKRPSFGPGPRGMDSVAAIRPADGRALARHRPRLPFGSAGTEVTFAVSPDGSRLAVLEVDGTFNGSLVQSPADLGAWLAGPPPLHALTALAAVRLDGNRWPATLTVRDVPTGRVLARHSYAASDASEWVPDLAFSADGGLLATVEAGGAVRLWCGPDFATPPAVALAGPDWRTPYGPVAVAPDGRVGYAVQTTWTTFKGAVRLRPFELRASEPATGRLRRIEIVVGGRPDVARSGRVYGDNKAWDLFAADGPALLWDRRSFESANILRHQEAGPDLFEISDRTVTVLDRDTGAVRATLPGHRANASLDVARSPDGSRYATLAVDSTEDKDETVGYEVKLWDAADGRELAAFAGRAPAAATDKRRDQPSALAFDGAVLRVVAGKLVFSIDGRPFDATN